MINAILIGFIVFIVLLWVDFVLGKRSHQRSVVKRSLPIRYGDCELFKTGNSLYESLFHDINKATDHIHILFYIVREDELSQKLFQLLKKKAAEGLTVRILIDRVGGYAVSRKTRRDLRNHGVSFAFSRVPTFPFFFYKLNRRNHRKICVCDGTVAYLGGFNVGNEYLGLDPKLGHWRDFHLRITKQGVEDLQTQFLEDWHDATNERVDGSSYFPPLNEGSIPLKFQPTDGAHVEEIFLHVFAKAKNSITIGTPYYIPGKKIQQALINKARAGVKVTILLPQKADHILVKQAAMPYLKELIQAGCHVYQFTEGFFHAKVVIIDDDICDIGTANFDMRSFYLNQEMNCFIYDQSFISKVREAVHNDIGRSVKLTEANIRQRTVKEKAEEKIGTLFAKLL
jgi:cardiolipin synthase A/B